MAKMNNTPPAEESDPGYSHDTCHASAIATTSAAQPSGGLGAHFSNEQVAEPFRIAVEEVQQKEAAAAASLALELDILRRKGEARIAAATVTRLGAAKATTVCTFSEVPTPSESSTPTPHKPIQEDLKE